MANEMDAPDDHLLIRDEVARLLRDGDRAAVLRGLLGSTGDFDRALWAQARAVVCEEMGRNLASIPFAATSTALAALSATSDPSLRQLAGQWAAEGAVVAVAGTDGDRAAPGAPCRFEAGRLSGSRTMTPAGAYADHVLVTATDAHGDRVVVLADLSHPSIEREVVSTIDNSRGHANLAFDGAPVHRVGGPDLAETLLDQLAVLTAMEQIGGASACLEATRAYAVERRAFGKPIGANQAVKHQLADMYVRLQLARGASAAALRAGDNPGRRLAAAARLAANEAYDLCAQEAIQLHGALGATWEAPIQLHYRRSRCHALELGGPLIWRRRLVGAALKELGA